MPQNNIFPNKQTRAYELLELIAIFGEFPTKALSRLPGGETYKEAVVPILNSLV